MSLLFRVPDIATLIPVVPAWVGVYEALSEDAVLLPPFLMSCNSSIPAGGVVAVFPFVANSPSTRVPGTVVVMDAAVMARELGENRPAWTPTGSAWSTPANASRPTDAPTDDEKLQG
jgi:hypothetical protein